MTHSLSQSFVSTHVYLSHQKTHTYTKHHLNVRKDKQPTKNLLHTELSIFINQFDIEEKRVIILFNKIVNLPLQQHFEKKKEEQIILVLL